MKMTYIPYDKSERFKYLAIALKQVFFLGVNLHKEIKLKVIIREAIRNIIVVIILFVIRPWQLSDILGFIIQIVSLQGFMQQILKSLVIMNFIKIKCLNAISGISLRKF